jgi:hypothetical protein
MTLFDFLNQITYTKGDWDEFTEEDKKSWNNYMVHRFLSMYEPYIEIVNTAQKYQFEDKHLYNFYKSVIPKKKMFLKYIKSKVKGANQDLIKVFTTHFELSSREAREYIPLIHDEDITMLLQQRGFEDKQIKKLLK